MDSDLSISSFSSSSPLMNTSTKDENSVALNDVVAVSNGAGGFYLGKVTEQENDSFTMIMYHYKLDTRTHFLKQTELIMNFGYAGAKTVFDMSTDQQKTLLDRINDPGKCLFLFEPSMIFHFNQDQYSSSLLSLMVEIKKKEEDRLRMLQLVIDLLGQLTVTTDGHDLLSNALERNIVEYDELVEMVCSSAIREDNDVTINRLADLLAEVTLEKKNLSFIEKKLTMKNDLVTTRFLKKCLWKIGKLIGKSNVDNFDHSLALFNQHCWQLITTYCEP
ncbi:unnamed protein product [Rotaria magnacalcarata]|uniref:Uncharacterized protein n=2 Tax=Rotaria magnacalcarata TaxID=392030 RepID=A0A816EAR3_9BILA|nr:unnamed protein product [Rotaria magnacalcarata]CAF2082933.1 unnamed protein product [Rotaria magnacalcarata]CAF2263210.1 unnamed protein product [Rotaria magnacalcarata]CAF4128218.1 unnamed protein product [Rotaria magnacalcarata]CAF4206330.1 unnamed protein product [Rotaria magnacalcarata]